MAPFGLQIVAYLFLAGIAAGAALFGSLALTSGHPAAFAGGRRAVGVAILAALAGCAFLILDLASPEDFLLVLTNANTGSAISWGVRILVIFTLSAIYVWVATRGSGGGGDKTAPTLGGGDTIALWLLRAAALGMAIYPAFVLRQGEAFPLWQNPLLVPLVAVSAFHAGVATVSLLTPCPDYKRRVRPAEVTLGIVQLVILVGLLSGEGASPLAWGAIVLIGTLVPLCLAVAGSGSGAAARATLVLLGVLSLRYWLIAAGQTA